MSSDLLTLGAVLVGLVLTYLLIRRTVSGPWHVRRARSYEASRCPNAHRNWENPVRTTPHRKINGTIHEEIHSHE